MPAAPHPIARRTALTLGAVALVATGCDDGDNDDPASIPSSTPTTDPDTALVDSVLAELTHAETVALGAGFADLVALHRAHIEALDGPDAEPGTAVATKDAVRRTEQRLQKRLVQASVAAESGALARLLASMSAAVGQRLG